MLTTNLLMFFIIYRNLGYWQTLILGKLPTSYAVFSPIVDVLPVILFIALLCLFDLAMHLILD